MHIILELLSTIDKHLRMNSFKGVFSESLSRTLWSKMQLNIKDYFVNTGSIFFALERKVILMYDEIA